MRYSRPAMPTLHDIRTPALVLEQPKLERNVSQMAERMRRHGVTLRPHLKTAKCPQVAALATAGQPGGITVSTLAEAAYFAGHGFRDITYAVGITPSKLEAVAALQRQGALLRVLTDDLDVARAIGVHAAASGAMFHVLVEIDTGGGRGGLEPESSVLVDVARLLHDSPGVELDGVLTHAGHSYACDRIEDVRTVAEQERQGIVLAAARLRDAGIPCPVVSAGSTPTAVHAESLAGITEMRPGNYMFFDLSQVGLGSCAVEDVAVTVLASVIGHAGSDRRPLLDAGSLALSNDTGANRRLPGVGFGIVCDLHGLPLGGVVPTPGARFTGARVSRVNQEHGFLGADFPIPTGDLPVGSRVRILPNHACITAAMFDAYHVVEGGTEVVGLWPRVRGW